MKWILIVQSVAIIALSFCVMVLAAKGQDLEKRVGALEPVVTVHPLSFIIVPENAPTWITINTTEEARK